MQEDLANEIEAINSIYGDNTLHTTDEAGVYVLLLPDQDASLRIQFPHDYPQTPPIILGTQTSGEQTRKGTAAHIVDIFRDAIGRLWQPGEVCLFDVIEECTSSLETIEEAIVSEVVSEDDHEIYQQDTSKNELAQNQDVPPWILSDVVVEMKSVFIARTAPVTSPEQAHQYLQHLLENDKKVAKATHNITAHRIKGDNGVTYQDCDDDGETAAGGRLLHLLQLMDVWNVMVVVTRWYGGQKLGPARFGIINGTARDALVKAGYVEQETTTTQKKKVKR